eukprot:262564-Rhodomonas_salina.6
MAPYAAAVRHGTCIASTASQLHPESNARNCLDKSYLVHEAVFLRAGVVALNRVVLVLNQLADDSVDLVAARAPSVSAYATATGSICAPSVPAYALQRHRHTANFTPAPRDRTHWQWASLP